MKYTVGIVLQSIVVMMKTNISFPHVVTVFRLLCFHVEQLRCFALLVIHALNHISQGDQPP